MDIYQVAFIAGGTLMYLVGFLFTWFLIDGYHLAAPTDRNIVKASAVLLWPLTGALVLVINFFDWARNR